MSRSLDFNAIEQPTLDITMRDKERTVFRLSVPSVAFVEKMQALEPVLAKMKKGGNAIEAVKKVYDFFAEVVSHNEDGIKVTAEDLREVYGLSLMDLLALRAMYMDFISDINSAKN